MIDTYLGISVIVIHVSQLYALDSRFIYPSATEYRHEIHPIFFSQGDGVYSMFSLILLLLLLEVTPNGRQMYIDSPEKGLLSLSLSFSLSLYIYIYTNIPICLGK